MVYAQHPLSFWESGIWACAMQRLPVCPVKTSGTESPRSSGWHLSHMQNSLLNQRTKCVLWDYTGNRPLDACTRLSPVVTHRLFLCWLCLVFFHCNRSEPSGRESSCQCRKHRFNPWSRKILHAVEHLRLCAATTEALPQQGKPPQRETHAPQLESSLRLLQREKSPGNDKSPAQPKLNK